MKLSFPKSQKTFQSLAQAMAALNPEITDYEIRTRNRQYIVERLHFAFHYFQRTGRGAGLVELSALAEEWIRKILRKKSDDHTNFIDLLRDRKFRFDWLQKHQQSELYAKLDRFRDVRNRSTHPSNSMAPYLSSQSDYPSRDEIEDALYSFLQFASLYCHVMIGKNLFSEPAYERAHTPGHKFCDRFEVIELLFDDKTTKTYKVRDRNGLQQTVYTLKWVSLFDDNYQTIIQSETKYRPLFNNNPNVGRFVASFEEIPAGEILLLEYIDAWTLEQWIDEQCHKRLDSHSFYQLIYLWGGVLNALRDIHRQGYLHGNLTGKHILVTRDTVDAKLVTFDKCRPYNQHSECATDTYTLAKTFQDILHCCKEKPALPEALETLFDKATSTNSVDWFPDADAMYDAWLSVYDQVRFRPPNTQNRKIALVSCSNRKKPGTWPAEELYSRSPNFVAALKYAKDIRNAFSDIYVVSGRYGLVGLRQELPIYDFDLRELLPAERSAWATNIASVLKKYYDPKSCSVSLICDDLYTKHLLAALSAAGFSVDWIPEFFQSRSNDSNKTNEEESVMPSSDDFRQALAQQFSAAQDDSIVITSGELHRAVGGYPSKNHRMPVCCSVMRNAMKEDDLILNEPPSGQGASLTIRYRLPR